MSNCFEGIFLHEKRRSYPVSCLFFSCSKDGFGVFFSLNPFW